MRGEFLCAGGEEELMVGAAKDASCVGVDLYVDYLGVVGASDGDEGVKLEADGALKGGKHSICVGVFQGDDVVGGVCGGISLLVWGDECAVWCRFECCVGEGVMVLEMCDICEEVFSGV